MNALRVICVLTGGCLGTACVSTDRVVFVTSTSLGINLDKAPPTVSIAYDRTEGFIGPRLENGAVPPVVASIETGGSIFSPHIRQVYATGNAAAISASPDAPERAQPLPLEGDPAKSRLVFFGTTTTLGLKTTFGEGVLPDSLVFGYKRKEFSVIPLAQVVSGSGSGSSTKQVYPSVFGSIDTTTRAAELQSSGLTSQQFFATGVAADSLAASDAGAALRKVAVASMQGVLTEAEQRTAVSNAASLRQTQDRRLDTIVSLVSDGETIDSTALATMIDAVNAARANTVPEDLKSVSSASVLRSRLRGNPAGTKRLYEYASQP